MTMKQMIDNGDESQVSLWGGLFSSVCPQIVHDNANNDERNNK